MELSREELEFIAAGLQQRLQAAEVDILRLQYQLTKLKSNGNDIQKTPE